MIPKKRMYLLFCLLDILRVTGSEAGDREKFTTEQIVDRSTESDRMKHLGYTEATGSERFLQSESSSPASTERQIFASDGYNFVDDFVNEDYVNSLHDSSEIEHFTEDPAMTSTTVENNSSNVSEDDVYAVVETVKDVTNITASVGIEWMELTWKPPYIGDESDNVTYSIETCDGPRCNNVNGITESEYNVTNLDACTDYSITVVVVLGDRRSEGETVKKSTSQPGIDVLDVKNLTIIQPIDHDTIHLIWAAPQRYQNCISNYTIIQCKEQSCEETAVSRNASSYVAKDLTPCTEYVFTIKVYTEIAASSGQNINGRTSSPRPTKPQLAEAVTSNFSLYIYWKQPESGAMCIKHYRITVAPKPITYITSDTNITAYNLSACTTYQVYILAVTQDNSDGDMVTITGVTAPAVPNQPELNAEQPLITKNSISMGWFLDYSNNRCKNLMMTMMCNYTERHGYGYEALNGISTIPINSVIATSKITLNITVEELSPFTTYVCWATAINEVGSSKASNWITNTTSQDVPSASVLWGTNVMDTYFSFYWDRPNYLAGKLLEYELVIAWDPLFPVPDWCKGDTQRIAIVNLNDTVLSYNYTDLNAFLSYTAKIRAQTGAGWGNYSDTFKFKTLPGVPDAVSNLSYAIVEKPDNPYMLDVTLTWGLPCSLNGALEMFNVSVHGERDGYTSHSFSVGTNASSSIDKNEMLSINIQDLKGEYNYTFQVSAKVNGVSDLGTVANITGLVYPSGIPPQPDEEYVQSITIDPYKAHKSTTSATVLLPLFPNTNGDIQYYAIMVSQKGLNAGSKERFDLKNNIWPNIPSWEEAMLRDFAIPYQATKPRWDPYPTYVQDYGHMKAVKYLLGDDATCKEISSNTDQRLYCNGPLKPDTWYHVRMRAFTNGGYTDSDAFLIKTNAELDIAAVIGIVFGILGLGILTTMMLLVRKCSPQAMLRRLIHADMPGSPVPAPFTRKKFLSHCQQLVDNPGKLSNEFQLLQTLSVDLQMPTNTACLQANKKKNRYSDILPYDFSRVKLNVIDDDPNTDYINASFIRGYTGDDEYIACQGPKEETTYDFWRMVDQYNVNIIVMLTQLVEKGKEKCHQYFPTIRETFKYENMTIRCTSELDYRTYTQRTLMLQKENKKKSILHLHFKDWPDHDVPEDFDPMIHFCQIMRRNISAYKGFVVIHCSAGIGRTGTLIAIDILLQHLRDNRKLDVFGTVYRLRHHRINMVQRESQYAYVYNCIKQVLKNPYFLKTYKPPPVDPLYTNPKKQIDETPCSSESLVNTQVICLKDYKVEEAVDTQEPLLGN